MYDAIAKRITDAAITEALHRRIQLDFLCKSRTGHSQSQYFRISPMELLEASARLHELGHLTVWGADESQKRDWTVNTLFGQYGKILPQLLGRIDTDLIHACLALAFRADFFPFLGGSYSLDEIHPVSRFTSMIRSLVEWRLTHATGKDDRSVDARAAFHDRVVEALIERFGCVLSGDKFRQSSAALFRKFIDGEIRDLYSPPQIEYIEALLREKRSLATLRDARFDLESNALYWIWGEPTVFPFNLIFLDGARIHESVLNNSDAATSPGAVQLAIASTQAVSDIILYGDMRLYKALATIRGAVARRPAHFMLDVLKEFGVDREWRHIPTIPWSDEDLDYAFDKYGDLES